MRKKSKCVFCLKDQAALIYEDKFCFAIIDRNPINKYHVLVIPKKHYVDFVELPDPVASHVFLVAKKISVAIRMVCRPDAITHISDDDIARSGWNLVAHYKFHIIPRFKDDRVKIEWNRGPVPSPAALSRFAKAIRKHIKNQK